jgi:hypothetical protein
MNKEIPFIVFTGAGASRAEPISLPTMTEFFHQIMDEQHLPRTERIRNKQYFKFIFDTLYGKDDNYDLERVMGALYGLSDFTDNDCWRIFQNPIIFDNIINDLATQYNALRNNGNGHANLADSKGLIQSATDKTYKKYKVDAKDLIFDLEWLIREKYQEIPSTHIRTVYEPFFETLINKLKKLGSNQQLVLPFFTTNYDMSVDWFFEPWDNNGIQIQKEWLSNQSNKIVYIDGFSKRGWNKTEYSSIGKQEDAIYIPYFKLHGSLFWEKVAGVTRMGTNVASDPINPNELMIVYPSDKKVLLEDPYYFNQKQLEKYIKNTDKVVVIGFSFRDPEIVKLFENAMSDNESMKVIVICPEYDPKYFQEMDKFLKNSQAIRIQGYFGTKEVLEKLEAEL